MRRDMVPKRKNVRLDKASRGASPLRVLSDVLGVEGRTGSIETTILVTSVFQL